MDNTDSSDNDDQKIENEEIQKYRRYLPQTLAALANNLVSLNNGLFDGFPSIVIPSLVGLNKQQNPNEILRVTAQQASWIASCAFFVHPIGAFAGWIISDMFGRRKAIFTATIPFIIGWTMFGLSNSLSTIYIAFAIVGFGTGLKESASLAYTGEVCETSIRGVLLASAAIFTAIGYFLIFLLGSFLPWRKVALTCVAVPIFMILAMFLVPETPIWLLSKNRMKKSLESLKWLRGGASVEAVNDEYNTLNEYNNLSKKTCDVCAEPSIKCHHHPDSLNNRLKQLSRKRILKPFILISMLEFFSQFSGVISSRPYIFQILRAYAIELDAGLITITMSLLGLTARICLLSFIKVIGKRRIYLTSSTVTYLCCFGLSIFGFIFLPSGFSSFDIASNNVTHIVNSTDFSNIRKSIGHYSYFPLALILIMQFFITIGITTIPSLLTSEVFPFKYRSMLCCIVSAERYMFAAVASRFYFNVEQQFSLPGAALFYGCVSLIGFTVMCCILPETEGRSLEDIELHYNESSRSITDIKIRKYQETRNLI